MCRWSESSESRIVPCRRSVRRARRWAGVMSQGASVSCDRSRSWRATAQKASDSASSRGLSAPASSRSWVTGIAYQLFLL